MKKLILLLALFLLVFGCATVQHSETIDVDRHGATGHYQDSRSGKLYEATFAAGGGGVGSGPLQKAGRGGTRFGLGMGGFAAKLVSNQSQGDPRNFARAVAAIDMSKKLKSVRYDEETGIHEYEFVQPLAEVDKNPSRGSKMPPSFGRQPVQ